MPSRAAAPPAGRDGRRVCRRRPGGRPVAPALRGRAAAAPSILLDHPGHHPRRPRRAARRRLAHPQPGRAGRPRDALHARAHLLAPDPARPLLAPQRAGSARARRARQRHGRAAVGCADAGHRAVGARLRDGRLRRVARPRPALRPRPRVRHLRRRHDRGAHGRAGLSRARRGRGDHRRPGLGGARSRGAARGSSGSHYYDAHAPYQPPDAATDATIAERYAGEVAYVDREIGRLLAGLQQGSRHRGRGGRPRGDARRARRGRPRHLPVSREPRGAADPRRAAASRAARARRRPSPPAPCPRRCSRSPARANGAVRAAAPRARRRAEPRGDHLQRDLAARHRVRMERAARGVGRAAGGTSPRRGRSSTTTWPIPAEARNLAAERPDEARRLEAALASLEASARARPAPAAPIDPEVAEALRSLGYHSGASGTRSGTIDPKDGIALLREFDRAKELRQAGRVREAVAAFESLVGEEPGQRPVPRRAWPRRRPPPGRREAGIATLKHAIGLNPRLDFLHLHLADAYFELGRIEEARAEYELTVDPRPAIRRGLDGPGARSRRARARPRRSAPILQRARRRRGRGAARCSRASRRSSWRRARSRRPSATAAGRRSWSPSSPPPGGCGARRRKRRGGSADAAERYAAGDRARPRQPPRVAAPRPPARAAGPQRRPPASTSSAPRATGPRPMPPRRGGCSNPCADAARGCPSRAGAAAASPGWPSSPSAIGAAAPLTLKRDRVHAPDAVARAAAQRPPHHRRHPAARRAGLGGGTQRHAGDRPPRRATPSGFPAAVAPVPLTLPSHAALMTGLFPRRLGLRDNGQVVPAGPRTLAEALKARGYATAAFVSGYPLDSAFGLDRGFDVYDDALAPGSDGDLERPADATARRRAALAGHRARAAVRVGPLLRPALPVRAARRAPPPGRRAAPTTARSRTWTPPIGRLAAAFGAPRRRAHRLRRRPRREPRRARRGDARLLHLRQHGGGAPRSSAGPDAWPRGSSAAAARLVDVDADRARPAGPARRGGRRRREPARDARRRRRGRRSPRTSRPSSPGTRTAGRR